MTLCIVSFFLSTFENSYFSLGIGLTMSVIFFIMMSNLCRFLVDPNLKTLKTQDQAINVDGQLLSFFKKLMDINNE